MNQPRIRVAQSDELTPETLAELTALCATAFDEPFDGEWERLSPGLHVIAERAGRPAAHAVIIDRPLYLGHETDVAIDAAYVEAVATHPDLQGSGLATAVMQRVARIIGESYALGALSTGSIGFYARLGWLAWTGPTWVRMADGERIRSVADDGSVMILRTPRTPAEVDPSGPIAVDWRPGEVW